MPKNIEEPVDGEPDESAGEAAAVREIAPASSTTEPRRGATVGDLDDALAQYEREVPPAQQPPASLNRAPTAQPPAPPDPDDIERVLAGHERDTRADERRQAEVDILRRHAMAIDQEATRMVRERHDNEVRQNLLAEFAPTFAELRCSAAELQQRLLAEERTNPTLRQAVENRFQSAEHNHRAVVESRKAIEKVVGELAKRGRFDPDLTFDREAVTASMRGGKNTPPPEKPVRIGTMSDAELVRHVEKTAGYRPKFAQ
jgi:hypothetical protein